MSRKGDCWDNPVAESFFSTLKKELVWRTKLASREQARREVFEFVEVFHNRQRMHSYLGYMSPVEFELAAAKSVGRSEYYSYTALFMSTLDWLAFLRNQHV